MTRQPLAERIAEDVLFVDGAMGTELFRRGAEAGICNDYLNISREDIVYQVHESYLNAGSDAVITNTFGANYFALLRHGHSEQAEKINEAASNIARKAAGEGRYVLGDIGPCGDFLEPLGSVKIDDLKKAFKKQAKGLLSGGVDGFIIETMTALDEVQVALEAVRSVSDLPVIVSMAYDPANEDFRTMMGIDPERAFERLSKYDITAFGFNCGTMDLDGYVKLAQKCKTAIGDSDVFLHCEPNAGKPELDGGEAVYKVSPEQFAQTIETIHAMGARVIGGCCGTTPGHIAAAVQQIRG